MAEPSPNPSETLRLFVAVHLPDGLRRELRRLRHDFERVRWHKADQLHLTLHFLGDTERSVVPELMARLSGISFAPFALRLNGCGVYPNERRPRVFWLGVDDSPPLVSLYDAIGGVMMALSLPVDERAFTPHVTLARMTRGCGPRVANRLAAQAEPFVGREFRVDSFHLYSSDLQSGGAHHTCMHTIPCRGR